VSPLSRVANSRVLLHRLSRLHASLSVGALSIALLALTACTGSSASSMSHGGPPDVGAAPEPGTVPSEPSPPDDPRPASETSRLDLSDYPSSKWCPGCTAAAEGGDTTDFGGVPLTAPGCSYDSVTSEETVAEALASAVDLSLLPQGLDESFEADVHWRTQSRSSHLKVTARLDDRLKVTRTLPVDAGSQLNCGSSAQGTVHVTLESNDGSMDGSFDAFVPYWLSPPKYDRKLSLLVDWSAGVQLRGNLALSPDPTRTPRYVELQFLWYRVAPGPGDRIGIGIVLYYEEPRPCNGGQCNFENLALGVPLDDCLPWELPDQGACVALALHPQYGAPMPSASDLDAGSLRRAATEASENLPMSTSLDD
jgi:hypothetical protein